jgi:hypothetical protein
VRGSKKTTKSLSRDSGSEQSSPRVAVAANPAKSDRAIAEEIGVGKDTVSRARKKTTVAHAPVAKRTGKDGRKRTCPINRAPHKS